MIKLSFRIRYIGIENIFRSLRDHRRIDDLRIKRLQHIDAQRQRADAGSQDPHIVDIIIAVEIRNVCIILCKCISLDVDHRPDHIDLAADGAGFCRLVLYIFRHCARIVKHIIKIDRHMITPQR